MYGMHFYGIANIVGKEKLEKLGKKANSLNIKEFILGNSSDMGNYIKLVLLHSNDIESNPSPEPEGSEESLSKEEDREQEEEMPPHQYEPCSCQLLDVEDFNQYRSELHQPLKIKVDDELDCANLFSNDMSDESDNLDYCMLEISQFDPRNVRSPQVKDSCIVDNSPNLSPTCQPQLPIEPSNSNIRPS